MRAADRDPVLAVAVVADDLGAVAAGRRDLGRRRVGRHDERRRERRAVAPPGRPPGRGCRWRRRRRRAPARPAPAGWNRWAASDVELGGQTIRRGDLVIAILNSADRDPARFPDADHLDVRREDARHLAFGRGSHYCLGAPLARLEAEIAIETLLRRRPDLRLAAPQDELEWRPTPGFRRLVALPVAW